MLVCLVCPGHVEVRRERQLLQCKKKEEKKAKNSKRRLWFGPPERNVMASRQWPPPVEPQSRSWPLTEKVELEFAAFRSKQRHCLMAACWENKSSVRQTEAMQGYENILLRVNTAFIENADNVYCDSALSIKQLKCSSQNLLPIVALEQLHWSERWRWSSEEKQVKSGQGGKQTHLWSAFKQ